MSLRVLLVEPNPVIAASLIQIAGGLSELEHQADFEAARRRVGATAFDFLVTNLRLQEFNGLHLVHLAAQDDQPPKCIVYTDARDHLLAREVQRAGAFYDTAECLPVTFGAYLEGRLPRADRRDPTRIDRRSLFRGGRRCWDRHVLGLGLI
jgi:DNA-binding NtrC family response regulator